MKTKLFLLTLLFSVFGFSQQPINNYFGVSNYMFAEVTGSVNQAPNGASTTWNFNGLTQTGTNTDSFAAPTAQETMDYPGTTQVAIVDDGVNSSKVFYKVDASDLSFTGISNLDFTIDYNTDNAFIGTYPLTFGGATVVDNIAGTINTQGQTPTYTGTITTEVDAYGTLNFDIVGLGSYSGSVTRVKTEQSITFTISNIFPGTAVITNYNYYKDADGALVFRTTDGLISVPTLNVNQTITSREALITNTLSVTSNTFVANDIKIYPNPITDVLYLDINNSIDITYIKIQDINGRTVLLSQSNISNINISQLKAGVYFLNVKTDAGLITKKIIKK